MPYIVGSNVPGYMPDNLLPQGGMMTYTVGSNVPGYMPDNPPDDRLTFDEARAALVDNLIRDSEDCEREDDIDDYYRAIAQASILERSDVLYGGVAFIVGDRAEHALGRSYWIAHTEEES